ncbi:amidohydrolase family protein [Azospirillum canadense]|uniref:amidohydrolase family protein n=1 Tax=Azospirillum canadense TaxID=403962 RepID=UPI002226644E|nr:amidohydrolase family protein [Azospirillum canadense]MCW2244169.1 2,3-dihydroxybenzoate decarboxylase [Azospirillum canadense]
MTSRIRKIALEEHFTAPGFERYSKVFTKLMDSASQAQLAARLADFDELRLAEMDRAGIDISVLSQTGPSVQAEPDQAQAIRYAQENNDFLARQIQRHPDRLAGFASLPMHAPRAAADELERAVNDLGFKGALVNGHTNGVYYDDPAYDAFWDRMQALDVPLYLHPTDPSPIPSAYAGHPELAGAVWGWGVETGTHALRLLFGGVFDRFPRLKLILGHMGEGLPMLRWRFDSRFAVYSHGIRLERRPSEYFGRNIVITTSGVCSPAALQCAIDEMGAEAVMFSVDYPYESTAIAADFIEQAPVSEDVRQLVCHGNAERLLKLR